MGLFTLLTIILVLLKAFEVITIAWLWVFLPLAIDILIAVILYATVGTVFFKTAKSVNRSFR